MIRAAAGARAGSLGCRDRRTRDSESESEPELPGAPAAAAWPGRATGRGRRTVSPPGAQCEPECHHRIPDRNRARSAAPARGAVRLGVRPSPGRVPAVSDRRRVTVTVTPVR